jgi:hypothetical protein
LRGFKGSRVFTPCPLKLGWSAYKGREAGFMVLTIEPGIVPSSERIFQGKLKKANTRASLESYTSYDFSVCSAWLVFQEEIMFE